MGSRATIERLTELEEQVDREHSVVTQEMVAFREGLERSRQWLLRVAPLLTDLARGEKILYRALQALSQEYRGLPLISRDFDEKLKPLFDEATRLIERIPNF
jgi:hypothetical protein